MAKLSTLTDDFLGTTLSAARWNLANQNGGAVTVDNGYLELATSAASGSSIAAVSSVDVWDLGLSAIYVKVPYLPATGRFRLELTNTLRTTDSARVEFNSTSGGMYGYVTGRYLLTDGYQSTTNLGAYNATTMRYMRLRASSTSPTTTSLYVAFSVNGTTWTETQLTALGNWSSYTSARVTLSMSNNGVSAASRSAIIDAVNLNPAYTPADTGDPDTIGAPDVAFKPVPAPEPITDADSIGAPALTSALSAVPASLADPDTVNAPAASTRGESIPGELIDADTATGPTLTVAYTVTPGSLSDAEYRDLPAAAYSATLNPGGVADPETLGPPQPWQQVNPAPLGDPDRIDNPATVYSGTVTPDGVNDVAAFSNPQAARWPTPTRIRDYEALGTPDLVLNYAVTEPEGTEDLGGIANWVSVQFEPFYTGNYGYGPYGAGRYGVYYTEPAGITDGDSLRVPQLQVPVTYTPAPLVDGENVGRPIIGGDAVPPGPRPYPELIDGDTISAPEVTFQPGNGYGMGLYGAGLYGNGQVGEITVIPDTPTGRTNYNYSEGTYGEGIYYGAVGPAKRCDNPQYGIGTYGCGLYYGQPPVEIEAIPIFNRLAGVGRPTQHILGIGPWSPVIWWRGADNYGVGAGNLPARPALPLPAATSKGFTLRLNEGSEARAELTLPRGSGLVIDEMDTDLWWRRKDPRTGRVEMIGRFNTSHAQTSSADGALNVSLQFEDYRTLLAQRMILRYVHPGLRTDIASQWPFAAADGGPTPVADILRWAIPTNLRLDLSELDTYPLGTITQPYVSPPGMTIETLMAELSAISRVPWEWWIETPNDINARPKLRFQLGTRGVDKGVVLFDLGKGPSNIATWTRQAAAGNYVNSLLFTTDEGGLVKTIPAQIAQYGQRDGTASSSTTTGGLKQVTDALAQRKLNQLADRRPTYTVQLAPGFWRGRSHIDVADTVTLQLRLGKEHIEEQYRVSEINVDIDDVGAEQVTLTLGKPLPSPDPRSRRAPLQRLVRYVSTYTPPSGLKPVVTDE